MNFAEYYELASTTHTQKLTITLQAPVTFICSAFRHPTHRTSAAVLTLLILGVWNFLGTTKTASEADTTWRIGSGSPNRQHRWTMFNRRWPLTDGMTQSSGTVPGPSVDSPSVDIGVSGELFSRAVWLSPSGLPPARCR